MIVVTFRKDYYEYRLTVQTGLSYLIEKGQEVT